MSDSNKKQYTVSEMASELGLSKMTVYRYLKRSNISSNTVAGNVKVYNNKVLKSLKAHYDKDKVSSEVSHGVTGVTPNVKVKNDEYVAQLERDLKQAREENTHLLKLVDQAQQLQLLAENKVKQIETKAPENPPQVAPVVGPAESSGAQSSTKKSERGFWTRLFKG